MQIRSFDPSHRPSSISGGGDGLFLLRNVSSGTVLAFYNGVVIPADRDDSGESWDDCSYRIFANEEDDERMDIPIEFRDVGTYSATLAHKVDS